MIRPFAEVLDDLVSKRREIDQFKADHPELEKAMQLIEDYLKLFDEANKHWQAPTVIYPSVGPVINPMLINPAPVVIRPLTNPFTKPWTVTCEANECQ